MDSMVDEMGSVNKRRLIDQVGESSETNGSH